MMKNFCSVGNHIYLFLALKNILPNCERDLFLYSAKNYSQPQFCSQILANFKACVLINCSYEKSVVPQKKYVYPTSA